MTPPDLTPTEQKLLDFFRSRPAEWVSSAELWQALWPGKDFWTAQNSLRVAVHGLRRRLRDESWRVESAWGRGYRWHEQPIGRAVVA